ncbi:MAG: acyltransferase family protein [Janthinobacterium lividum]
MKIDSGMINTGGAPLMKATHIGYLDGLRGCAALYVVISHVAVYMGQGNYSGPAWRVLIFLLGGGHFAVDVFIVLSGYCLMLGARNKTSIDPTGFLIKRAWRILPPYFATLAFAYLALWPWLNVPGIAFWGTVHRFDAWSLYAQLLLLQDWLGTSITTVNPVTWSVAVEWKIYFLFPAIFYFTTRKGPLRTALFLVVVSYAIFAILLRRNWLDPLATGSSVYYVGLFSCGVATAFIQIKKLHRTLFSKPALMALAAFFGAGVFLIIFKKHSIVQVGSFFGGGLTCVFLAFLSQHPRGRAARFLASRPMEWLGIRSYSLYLTHPIAFLMVKGWIINALIPAGPNRVIWCFLLMIPASMIVMAMFYALIEAPSTHLSRRFGRTRTASPLQAELTTEN